MVGTINKKSAAWKWMKAMREQYQNDRLTETGEKEIFSLIDGHKIGKVIFRKEIK